MIKTLLFGMPNISPRLNVIMTLPNHGLVSLAGNIDPSICDVRVADLVSTRHKWQDVTLDLLKKYSPDLVGLSFMSVQYQSAVKLVRLIKEYDKNIKIVIGGYHPTLMYEEISESPDFQTIDFIVRGEGEATLNELVTALNAGTGYDKIAGLSYRVNETFHHNPSRELLDLNSIQLPNRDARIIKKGFSIFGFSADNIETSRGCTNKCKFCSVSKMHGRTFRTYETNRVIADISDAQRHGAKYLSISDDNITTDIKRLENLCDEIISNKLDSIHYFVQATVNSIAQNPKLVKKMADAGIKAVFLGIESTKSNNLIFLDKRTSDTEDTKNAVRNLKDNGIITLGGFIVGMPDDDEKSLWDIFNDARELKIDIPVFSILIPQPKTEIRDELMAQGLVTNTDDYQKYDLTIPNIKTKYLSPEDLGRITQKMYDNYLVNLNYIWFNQVRRLYPAYFWKTALMQIPLVIRDLIKRR
jgi:anaerobic magnesium-protoporphyrin IX monomethyl ester cyclase